MSNNLPDEVLSKLNEIFHKVQSCEIRTPSLNSKINDLSERIHRSAPSTSRISSTAPNYIKSDHQQSSINDGLFKTKSNRLLDSIENVRLNLQRDRQRAITPMKNSSRYFDLSFTSHSSPNSSFVNEIENKPTSPLNRLTMTRPTSPLNRSTVTNRITSPLNSPRRQTPTKISRISPVKIDTSLMSSYHSPNQQERISHLLSAKIELERTNIDLSNEACRLRRENESFEEMNNKLNKTVNRLTMENSNFTKDIAELKSINSNLKINIQNLELELKSRQTTESLNRIDQRKILDLQNEISKQYEEFNEISDLNSHYVITIYQYILDKLNSLDEIKKFLHKQLTSSMDTFELKKEIICKKSSIGQHTLERSNIRKSRQNKTEMVIHEISREIRDIYSRGKLIISTVDSVVERVQRQMNIYGKFATVVEQKTVISSIINTEDEIEKSVNLVSVFMKDFFPILVSKIFQVNELIQSRTK